MTNSEELDDQDEALMDDAVMIAYLKKAIDSGDVKQIMTAAKRVVNARDPREVVIREFARNVD